MKDYSIKKWDAVSFGSTLERMPMIYISPDLDLVSLLEKNHSVVSVEISGTNSVYDGKKIIGYVSRSCDTPNCRPNYFAKTGYYVIVLQSFWYGYPDTDGNVKVMDLYQSTTKPAIPLVYPNSSPNSSPPAPSPTPSPNPKPVASSKTSSWIWVIIPVLFLLFLLLMLLKK